MSDQGLTLVFGGGNIGLMGVLADAVLTVGGRAIGVIPQALVDKELAHRGCTELRIVQSMHERKAVMADLSDGFIALLGAFGTIDELFEMLTWAQLGIHTKPIGLLDVGGYFSQMLAWLDRSVEEGFLKQPHRQLLLQAERPEELIEILRRYRPPAASTKWIQESER
jgi:uncharacterized protein (TIGR00730 family)